jgi:hypothetical protein
MQPARHPETTEKQKEMSIRRATECSANDEDEQEANAA